MSEPVFSEKVERDESKSYGEQAHEIAEKIKETEGIEVFGDKQTHYVNTSIVDGEVVATVHEVEPS